MPSGLLCNLFYSYLVYGSSIWGLTYQKNLDVICKLQKKCIRIITFSDFYSPTNQLFYDLNLLKVDDIIKSQQLKLIDYLLNCKNYLNLLIKNIVI